MSNAIGEPHRVQKWRFIGSPVCPPGIVKVVSAPVMAMLSAGNASAARNAVPVCL